MEFQNNSRAVLEIRHVHEFDSSTPQEQEVFVVGGYGC